MSIKPLMDRVVIKVIEENYEYMCSRLAKYIDILPLQGTYLVFANFKPYAKNAAKFLEDKCGIVPNAGETFATAVKQECTVSKNDSVTDEELDTWASFGNSYTNVHYVYTDNDTLEVEYDFSSSQVYNSVKDPLNNDQGDLKITDNYYTVTFTVTSGTEPIDVTVTNAGNNTFRNSGDSTATVSFSYKASLTFMPAQDVVIAFNDAYTSNSNKKIRKSVEL